MNRRFRASAVRTLLKFSRCAAREKSALENGSSLAAFQEME
jgi:hypothetical protein